MMDGVGGFGWSALTRRCGGRSRGAVQKKILREFGGGGITRGTYSILQAMAETGYHVTQLRRAAQALNQRWARTARGGNFLISAEQLEECAVWLQKDYWSVRLRLYGCCRCGSDTKPHFSLGHCKPCYERMYRYARNLGLVFSSEKLLVVVRLLRSQSVEHARVLESIQARLELGQPPNKEDLLILSRCVK